MADQAGVFEIAGDEGNEKKYCKVDLETDLESILTKWNVKRTGLVISLTGKTFNDTNKQIEIVKAFAQVIGCTGALLTSDATGDVGDILRESILEVEAASDYQPAVIGIFHWRHVAERLANSKVLSKSEDDVFDSHFSHFLFVDDGVEIAKFRRKFDAALYDRICGEADSKVPVVVMALGAEPTEDYLESTIHDRQPVLIYDQSKTNAFVMPKEKLEGREDFLTRVEKGNSIEYANAILKAVIGADDKDIDSLKLSIVWNESDEQVAPLVKENKRWENESYRHKLLKFALESDNGKTAMTLVENGIDLPNFCNKHVIDLYNKINVIKPQNNSFASFADVQKYITAHTEVTIDIADGFKSEETALNVLYIWAIFALRYTVSYRIWRQLRNKMSAAVFACKALRQMKKATDNLDVKTQIVGIMGKYDHRSTWILTKCYANKNSKAKQALVRERSDFGGTSTLLMADDNRTFIQHAACQSVLNDIWLAPLAPDVGKNPLWKIMLCMANPVLAVFFLTFNDRTASTDKMYEGKTCGAFRWIVRRVWDYTHSPLVKFMYNMLSYLVFLTLFAYSLIFNTDASLYALNYVLWVWVFTFVVEEVRQKLVAKEDYITDIWNWIDLLALGLFVAGQVIRFFYLDVGRVIMAVDFIVFSLRLLHACSCLRNIGPKLVMIGKMMLDLYYFFIIMMVVVISYAIATQSILYPNSPLSWKTLHKTMKIPFWNIFGELGLEEIEGMCLCVVTCTCLYAVTYQNLN